MKTLRTLVLLLIVVLAAQYRGDAREWTLPEPPYSVEQLRAWHESMAPWPWLGPPEVEVHLRDETEYELLLAISGYARGGTFVLFAERNGIWTQISDEIEQAHHPLHILKNEHEGWHDFRTFVPLWRGGNEEVLVSTYSWNGTKYVLITTETGRWCDYEPFMDNSDWCPADDLK